MESKMASRQSTPDYIGVQESTPAQLNELRKLLEQHRDLQFEIENADTLQKDRKERLRELEFKTLPDMFNKVGVDKIGLESTGNMPGYDAKRAPYYHANIATSWPEEKRQAAFDWLEKHGGGDLIKAEIVLTIPSKNMKLRKMILSAVKKFKVQTEVNLTVPWGSLTSFIKESITKHGRMPPLDLLGAEVGERVQLKPRK
jgi:hypothetical protein